MSKKKNRAPAYYDYNYGAPVPNYDPRAEAKKLNNKLIPFNIIIAVIAIVGLVTLLIGNFWTFSASYNMDQATLEKFLANANLGGEGSGETGTSPLEGIDLSSLDIDVSFGVSIALEPDVLLKAAAADDTATVQGMLDPIISSLLSQATTVFKSLVKSVAKLAVATAMAEINETLATEASTDVPEVATAIEAMDMETVNSTIDELLSDDPDIPVIKENLVNLIIDQAVAQYELQSDTPVSEEDLSALEAEIDTQVGGAIDNLVTEMGGEENFNVNNIVLKMAGETGFVELPEGEQLTEEALSSALRDSIMGAMNEQTLKIASIVVKVFSFMLIIPIAAWGLLALFSILRIFMKFKGVKLWFAILTGAIPYVLLIGLPTLLIKYAPTLIDKLGGTVNTAGVMDIIGGFSVTFSGLTWISAVCVAALIIISIFFYGRFKRKAKRFN